MIVLRNLSPKKKTVDIDPTTQSTVDLIAIATRLEGSDIATIDTIRGELTDKSSVTSKKITINERSLSLSYQQEFIQKIKEQFDRFNNPQISYDFVKTFLQDRGLSHIEFQ